jgi:hypothetical protein
MAGMHLKAMSQNLMRLLIKKNGRWRGHTVPGGVR